MMDENNKKKSGDSETDPPLTPPKKIKNYEHKLSNKLLNDERFSAWIELS